MISSGLLDAIVIATPDDAHRQLVLPAVAAGLHVLCEKPLARTARDAREMLDAAQAAQTVHMVMFTWRRFGIFTEAQAAGFGGRARKQPPASRPPCARPCCGRRVRT